MKDEFDALIAAAQQRLKASNIRVYIRRKGDALFLRATLPPKPGTGYVKPHRYELATKLPVSRDGIRRAEAEAQNLGSLLAMKQFDWSDWLNETPPEEKLIGEWIREFKQHYTGTHALSETTWKRHWQTVYDALPQSETLMATTLVVIALNTPSNTRN